jgi:hypothetical protein
MSRKYRAEQQKARARMRDWRRGQRYRARVRVYGAVFAGVGLVTFLWVLVGQLQ